MERLNYTEQFCFEFDTPTTIPKNNSGSRSALKNLLIQK